jgi:hypothetical protein
MKLSKKFIAIPAIALAAGIGLAACGSSGHSSSWISGYQDGWATAQSYGGGNNAANFCSGEAAIGVSNPGNAIDSQDDGTPDFGYGYATGCQDNAANATDQEPSN